MAYKALLRMSQLASFQLTITVLMQNQPATRTLRLEQPLALYRGDQIDPVCLAYECWGELNAARDNAILLLTGLSPGAHAASSPEDPEAGWWENMLGPGKPIDTHRYFVICVNSLGSCKGSTGPASLNPKTGKTWRLDFPELTLDDIAEASWQVVKSLRIEQLNCLIGPSMGGMTALALLKRHPNCARRLISISSATAASPFSIAIRSLQREAIVSDPNWQSGEYTDDRWPVSGMRLARKLGMISYRSAAEWIERFGRQPQEHFPATVYGMNFAVESYLEAQAQKFIGQFDPVCYVYLSRAMDWFEAGDRHQGSPARMLAQTSLETALVLGVETDLLFPLEQQKTIAKALQAADIKTDLHELSSIQGHDAFLIDMDSFAPPVAQFLS